MLSTGRLRTLANQMLQKRALDRLLAYRREGTIALGVYNDKEQPTDVRRKFQYVLSYTKVLPERVPQFYRYLLSYPREKPVNVKDLLYWAKVKRSASRRQRKSSH